MSVTATAVVLGLLVLVLIKTRWLHLSGALLCVVFGFVLAATAAGPAVADVLHSVGTWAYGSLQSL